MFSLSHRTISASNVVDYDSRYHKAGSFEKAMLGLRRLVEEKRRVGRTKPIVHWRYLLFNWNDSDACIEEALRLYPAGWLMTRRALRDDRIGDYFVPAGTEIYISPYFIQRHPGLWVAPDSFDPDRFGKPGSEAGAMLPFSAGPRNCIGEHLARMEMQLHLVMTARDLELRYAPDKPPGLAAGVNLLSAEDLYMRPMLRRPAASGDDATIV